MNNNVIADFGMSPLNTYMNMVTDDVLDKLKVVKYRAVVPMIATYSQDEIKLYGMPLAVNGDGETNEYAIKELTNITTSIYNLLDIYSNGYSIRIVSDSDIVEISKELSAAMDILELLQDEDSLIYLDKMDGFLKDILKINREYIIDKHKKDNNDVLGRDLFLSTPVL